MFWLDILYSFKRVLIGFGLSFIVAYPLMLVSLLNKNVKKVVFNLVEFFRYLPIPVFIPLTILWFGIGDFGKIFIIFLGTFAQMIPMFYDSANLLNNKFPAFTAALKWKKTDHIKKIIIPGSAPLIMDNARLCFGWAWTYLIIAELLGAENGMGYAIIRAQRYLATDKIFAYIITIGLIGVLIDRSIYFFKNKLENISNYYNSFLRYLDISYNEITLNLFLPYCKELYINNTNLNEINLSYFPEMKILDCSNNNLAIINGFNNKLQELDISNNKINYPLLKFNF
jgi:NitT/TauT family transport system permease protein